MKPMFVEPLAIEGAFLIESSNFEDERGSFEKIFSGDKFENSRSLSLAQINVSRNWKSGTIRGLHFQVGEFVEYKIVSCLVGGIFDVILDMRKDSKTFGRWQSILLSESSNAALLPPGVAHGFQTIVDNTVVQYVHSSLYSREHSRGIRFDDPTLNIPWPNEVTCVSLSDQNLPFFEEYIEL